jgi:hypothetical protein
MWSQATQAFFPPEIKDFYARLPPPAQVISRSKVPFLTSFLKVPKVMEEFHCIKSYWRNMDRTLDGFITHYRQNPANRPLFLCVVWLVTMEHRDRMDSLRSMIHAFHELM